MIRIERILVPVDFSESSEKALRYGHEIARERGAGLYLLHVIHQHILEAILDMSAQGYGGEYGEVLEKLVKERREDLENFVPLSMREGIGINFEVRQGKPADEVVKFAREIRTDLIILGTVGRSAIEAALVGSVARNVANHAPCPVLLVRPVEHDFIR